LTYPLGWRTEQMVAAVELPKLSPSASGDQVCAHWPETVQHSAHWLQATPPIPHVALEEVSHCPPAVQHPVHEVPSHTHWPAVLQCKPEPATQVPLAPVQMPPAPSGPPQATPTQFGDLHTPSSFSKPLAQVTARQLPAPSHKAVFAWLAVHAVVFGAGGEVEHWPVVDEHVPARWHWSLAGHDAALQHAPFTQLPVAH